MMVLATLDDCRYLDYMGAVASTSGDHVLLGPAAFTSEEALARTIVHEGTHVTQYLDGRVAAGAGAVGSLEAEAYAAEDQFRNAIRGVAL